MSKQPQPETGTPTGELYGLLADSDGTEAEEVVRLFQRALRVSLRGPLGELDLIHSMLKNTGALVESSTSTKKPPAVCKVYEHAPQVRLTTEFVNMEYSLEQVVRARAARRDYVDRTVASDVFSTFLHWSCGIKRYGPAYNTGEFPVRFTPSGGGLQPWEIYIVVNNVERLDQGLYHYRAQDHSLELMQRGQMRSKMVELAFGVEFLHHASYVCIITCIPERFYWKYGVRGYRTAHIDAGVLVQSMWYVATALRLRSLPISGFSDDGVDEFLGLDPRNEFSMILFVVGARPDTGTVPVTTLTGERNACTP